MDSSSIGEMCACLRRASDVSGTVKLLLKPNGTIDEVIRLSALHRVFHVYYNEAEMRQAGPPRRDAPAPSEYA